MLTTIKCPGCGSESSVSLSAPGGAVVCQCGARLDPSALAAYTPYPSGADPPSPHPAGEGEPPDQDHDPQSTGEPPPSLGQVGRYRLVRPVGVGGFSTV